MLINQRLVHVMQIRNSWENRIQAAWRERSIIWLTGVRRAGKTSLCKTLANTLYFDCELPSVRRQLEDPELFLAKHREQTLALDEIHRLSNPSELLKIAADHFPDIKIIATGSSSLGASSKFGDTLTGRKNEIWLTPMLFDESELFGQTDLSHRMLHGGLPPYFLNKHVSEKHFSEWLEAYWAKDIQELFKVQKRFSFLKFTELLWLQSGSIFEATRFTSPCEISRSTIHNYLMILEATFIAHIVRPFHQHTSTETTSAPKVYGFDTGFVAHAKGWHTLKDEDKGLLWEHIVLNEMHGQLQTRAIHYWRDKRHHEIDFIYIKNRQNKAPIAIECKWQAKKFHSKNLKRFRKHYPEGKNMVVAHDIQASYQQRHEGMVIDFVSLKDLIRHLW